MASCCAGGPAGFLRSSSFGPASSWVSGWLLAVVRNWPRLLLCIPAGFSPFWCCFILGLGHTLCAIGPVASLRSCCFLRLGCCFILDWGAQRCALGPVASCVSSAWSGGAVSPWVGSGFCALLACCSIMLRPGFLARLCELLALPASAHVPRQAGSGPIPPPPPPWRDHSPRSVAEILGISLPLSRDGEPSKQSA